MRFFPRMIGMAMYLGLPELCAWLIPEHFVVHAAFVFCFSLQPHLALAVVLCSVRPDPRPPLELWKFLLRVTAMKKL